MPKHKPDRIAMLAQLGYKVSQNEGYKPKRSKYNAVPTNGHDSRKEYKRSLLLKQWERMGIISNLREQVPYLLIPAQYGECGTDHKGKPVRVCLERSCKYIADFVYTFNATGKTIVEDSKGARTPEYIIKRKLMLYLHGIRIKET